MKKIFALLMVAVMAASPIAAQARAGGGFTAPRASASISRPTTAYNYNSVGSKGLNTYTPSQTYKPITQSVTPTQTQSSMTTSRPYSSTPAPSSTYYPPTVVHQTSPGLGSTALAVGTGALAGSLLGNALSNHNQPVIVNGGGYAGAPMVAGGAPVVVENSGAGFFLTLIAILIVIAVVWYVFQAFRRNRVGSMSSYDIEPHYEPMVNNNVTETTVSQVDKIHFKSILTQIQHDWSNRSKLGLRRNMTTEMYDYMVATMDGNTAMGVINIVDNVTGVECDVLESWKETDKEYATCIMRWSAHDYTVDSSNGKVIDNGTTGYSKETWTFVRDSFDAKWKLSAIQQMEG